MERPIGEKFYFEGVKLEVLEGKRDSCEGCYFIDTQFCCNEDISHTLCLCGATYRNDKKDVIFRQIG